VLPEDVLDLFDELLFQGGFEEGGIDDVAGDDCMEHGGGLCEYTDFSLIR
jgi:hypothetical protein